MTTTRKPVEAVLRSSQEWSNLVSNSPELLDDRITDAIRQASLEGIIEPLTGRTFRGSEIEWRTDNYRETGIAAGLISRHRATLYAIEACVPPISKYETKIYAAEALTEFALLMRSRYPKFVGSEYALNEHVEQWLKPILSEDLTALSFPGDTFDLVITNEVLEHVPSLDKALQEICRVLKPGGWHVGTCPFLFDSQKSVVKSQLIDGKVTYLTEPEYHGNPMSEEGSLVFELPGWDILDRARRVGFSEAFFLFVQSEKHGIASNQCGGVFVLCLQR